jgi:hypothetical protein
MANESDLLTTLLPDDPVVLGAGYYPNQADRRFIDNQIQALQTAVTGELLNGIVSTHYTLSGSSVAVTAGDLVCSAASVQLNSISVVTKAVLAALTDAPSVLGIVLEGAAPGGRVKVAICGMIPTNITGLAAGAAQFVICNTTTARCESAASVTGTDYPVGTIDTVGNLSWFPGPIGGGGGGSSGLTVSDEGVDTGADATLIDFVGAGVSVTSLGGNKTVTIPGGSGVDIEEEGVAVGTVTTINHVGASCTATLGGGGEAIITHTGLFGTGAAVTCSDVSVGADPAAAGGVRLSNGTAAGISANNAAGSADLNVAYYDPSNRLFIGSTSGGGDGFISATGQQTYRVGSGQIHEFQTGGTARTLIGEDYVSIGLGIGGVAGAGTLRFPITFDVKSYTSAGVSYNALSRSGSTFTYGDVDANAVVTSYNALAVRCVNAGGTISLQVGGVDLGVLTQASCLIGVNASSSGLGSNGTNSTYLRCGGAAYLSLTATDAQFTHRMIGDSFRSSAYGVHGGVTVAFTTASLTAAQYSLSLFVATGSPGGTQTATYPNPATLAASYWKLIRNAYADGSALVVSVGAGVTVSIPALQTALVCIENSNVYRIGAADTY